MRVNKKYWFIVSDKSITPITASKNVNVKNGVRVSKSSFIRIKELIAEVSIECADGFKIREKYICFIENEIKTSAL